MNRTVYDPKNKVARIEPGSNWGHVYEVLDPYGVAAVGGRASPVGVGGFTTGGGVSMMSTKAICVLTLPVLFPLQHQGLCLRPSSELRGRFGGRSDRKRQQGRAFRPMEKSQRWFWKYRFDHSYRPTYVVPQNSEPKV